GWRWKEARSPHAIGSSVCKSSPQEAFDERIPALPLNAMECAKNNDPLELFVFVSFCERLSSLSLRPIHCAEAVSSFMIEAGTPSMKADTVSDARLEAGTRWVQGVFEHVRDRDAQTRQLFASHCVV